MSEQSKQPKSQLTKKKPLLLYFIEVKVQIVVVIIGREREVEGGGESKRL